MQSFWAEHADAVIVAVVISLFTVFLGPTLREFAKDAGQKLTDWLGAISRGQGPRFRRRYLNEMAERHGRLKLIGVYNRGDLHPPRLREVFISLRVASGQEDGPKMGWSEALGPDRKRIVILGAPGAGKTTLLDYLVLVLAGEVKHPLRAALGTPIPMFVRLRELGASGKDDLMSLLRASVPFVRVPAWCPERWLEKGRCAVLLDGLDEVLDEGRHTRAVEEITRLVADFPDNVFVVTCRLAGWRNQLAERDFHTYEVQELDGDDVRKFLGSWYREVLRAREISLLGVKPRTDRLAASEERAREQAGRRAEDLWTALSKNESLLRLARTPLVLSLVTLVHFHRKTDLPKGRAALYDDCLRILLERWDAEEKDLEIPGPTLKEKLMVLKEVAFLYLEGDRLEADLPTLVQIIEPLLPKIEFKTSAEALVRQIELRSGVLVELALGRYGFAHRALHDALAADWVIEHERDDLLLSHAGEERWREVILIAAGRAPAARARALVEALLQNDAGGNEEWAALQVAGFALAEDVQLGDDLRGQVRRRLMERLSQEEAAGTFGRLAGALLAGDPEAARDWMKKTLNGEKDPRRRTRLLELLPSIGEDHARLLLPLVGKIVGDSTVELESRIAATLALAGVGFASESDIWDSLDLARNQNDEKLKAAATWTWCELGRFADLGLVKVPAGEFLMGSNERERDSIEAERPQHTLYLPTFYLGKFPATVVQFRAFMEVSNWVVDYWVGSNPYADHPTVRVSWHDALAYTRWRGMSLPSEAEWEKGARGTDGRTYPWGNEWRFDEGKSRKKRAPLDPMRRHRWGGNFSVGQYSPQEDSPYGCADMAGNVWEWTRSIWGQKVERPEFGYPYRDFDGRENLESASRRVLRGGVDSGPKSDRCAVRGWAVPGLCHASIGFRVVVSPFRSGPWDSV